MSHKYIDFLQLWKIRVEVQDHKFNAFVSSACGGNGLYAFSPIHVVPVTGKGWQKTHQLVAPSTRKGF